MKYETIKISKTGAGKTTTTMLHPQIRTANNINNKVAEDYLKTCNMNILLDEWDRFILLDERDRLKY